MCVYIENIYTYIHMHMHIHIYVYSIIIYRISIPVPSLVVCVKKEEKGFCSFLHIQSLKQAYDLKRLTSPVATFQSKFILC